METIFIIHSRNKWGVYKRHSRKAVRVFKHRDLAFHYATRYRAAIIVMTKDGELDFTHVNTIPSILK